MNLFQFRSGNAELLPYCESLWDLFIHSQIKNAGVMSDGISEYIQGMRNGDLLTKTARGKLHIQLVDLGDINKPIGFCITSLSKDKIGEVEVLYILEEYQGNHLGTQLLQTALKWMAVHNVMEKRLKVVVGNENIFGFYQKFKLYPVYTALLGVN